MSSDNQPKHALNGKLGQEAGRSDAGKRIIHTVDPDFITGIGRVSAFGAKKYHMRNFLMAPGMAWGRVFDSLMGHLMAHWGGEDLDEESGQPHILMAGWNLMVLHTYWENPVYHPGDDRPSMIEHKGKLWADWEAAFNAAKGIDAPAKPVNLGDIALSTDGRTRPRSEPEEFVELARKFGAGRVREELGMPPIEVALAKEARDARWRKKLFNTWQPRMYTRSKWAVCMERMGKPVLYFVDEMDRDAKHVMDEDEAIDTARRLNSMNWTGEYDGKREHWHAIPAPTNTLPTAEFLDDPLGCYMNRDVKGYVFHE